MAELPGFSDSSHPDRDHHCYNCSFLAARMDRGLVVHPRRVVLHDHELKTSVVDIDNFWPIVFDRHASSCELALLQGSPNKLLRLQREPRAGFTANV